MSSRLGGTRDRTEPGSPSVNRGLPAVSVGLILALLVGVGLWLVVDAVEQRQVAMAATKLQAATATIAVYDSVHSDGREISDMAGFTSAFDTLVDNREIALKGLASSERDRANELLDQIGECAVVIQTGEGHDIGHEHTELQQLLVGVTDEAELGYHRAERRALAALLVAGMVGLMAVAMLLRYWRNGKQLQTDLARQATTDELTGFGNRRTLDVALDRAKVHMESTGTGAGLLTLNIDRFNEVNNFLGNKVGDEILKVVADRIRGVQRSEDITLRMGGDEFSVVLTGLAPDIDLGPVAARYLAALEAPIAAGDGYEVLTTSIGVSATTDPLALDDLRGEADMALEEAKRAGGDAVVVFNPELEARVTRARAIGRALSHSDMEEFHLVYQPIVDVQTGSIAGLEALLRWDSPTLGSVSPGDFIPVAEIRGHIGSMGDWVIEKVCQQMCEWDDRGIKGFNVSCNVSPIQLGDDHLVDVVLGCLDRWPAAKGRLVLEVTESAALDPGTGAVERLHRLRRHGVMLAIDDFGSGYSNLGQLFRLPFDVLKIDRSLLADGDGSSSANPPRALESVAILVQGLRARVVCEGIESQAQLEMLRQMKVGYAQGMHTGRPQNLADIESVLTGPVTDGAPISPAMS